MFPNSCCGLEVTWACNASCVHCFFKRFEELHTINHFKVSDILEKAKAGRSRGCDRVVLEGKGEPFMHPEILTIISGIRDLGMRVCIITNGTLPVYLYERAFNAGLDHLQISMHGVGEQLDDIMELKGAGKKQKELVEWLDKNDLPFRTNTTLQSANYKNLTEIVSFAVEHGAFHVALLGFLPHYHWKDHSKDVAVHPAMLRPEVERASEFLMSAGSLFTIRYHPLCHLSPKFWPFVTNARYVLFDPWEWDYGRHSNSVEDVWPHAVGMGESVANRGPECSSCGAYQHCGGWNKVYADTFAGADIRPVVAPEEWQELIKQRGGLFMLNPANSMKDGRSSAPKEVRACRKVYSLSYSGR